ncbi:MAG: diacylglycerol kinase [Deltaproteobacteria bacterium]|nr:diacylglycerol kinase [Deltaproteobacteria bacterium]
MHHVTPPRDFGVVLNANAGRVTPRLARRITDVVGRERVFLTLSPDHAREVVETCVEREYGTIFAGGGDGTVVGVINLLHRLREQVARIPDLGVLRLGTGNALARWLGSASPVHDLGRYARGEAHRVLSVSMVEAEGTLFPFAGLGNDAAVLNDYNALVRAARGTWYEPVSLGLSGYFLASLTRTIPNYLFRPRPEVQIINLGTPAIRVDVEGRPVGPPVPEGGLLYEGPISIVGAATTPFYGYGLKLYPHATLKRSRFHLRIINLTPLQSLSVLVPAWRGRLVHPNVHDFLADRVRVRFAEAIPYQLGGEAHGYRNEVTFGLGSWPVRMVRKA